MEYKNSMNYKSVTPSKLTLIIWKPKILKVFQKTVFTDFLITYLWYIMFNSFLWKTSLWLWLTASLSPFGWIWGTMTTQGRTRHDKCISGFLVFRNSGLLDSSSSALYLFIPHCSALEPYSVALHSSFWNQLLNFGIDITVIVDVFLRHWWLFIAAQLWIPSAIWNNRSGSALVHYESGSKYPDWLISCLSHFFTLPHPDYCSDASKNPTRIGLFAADNWFIIIWTLFTKKFLPYNKLFTFPKLSCQISKSINSFVLLR